MRRFCSFITGVLIGSLVGSVIALLYAPMKGMILRQKLQDYALEVKDEVKQAAISKREELEAKIAQFRK